MKPISAPYSGGRSLLPRIEFSPVDGAWLRSQFGEPMSHEESPDYVLTPTDYWAFEEREHVLVLAYAIEERILLVSSDSDDTDWIASVLGLVATRRHVWTHSEP
jgi:hypothetical protein